MLFRVRRFLIRGGILETHWVHAVAIAAMMGWSLDRLNKRIMAVVRQAERGKWITPPEGLAALTAQVRQHGERVPLPFPAMRQLGEPHIFRREIVNSRSGNAAG